MSGRERCPLTRVAHSPWATARLWAELILRLRQNSLRKNGNGNEGFGSGWCVSRALEAIHDRAVGSSEFDLENLIRTKQIPGGHPATFACFSADFVVV